MKCPTCGAEMALTDKVCPQCHNPRPQWPLAFEETARRFADLKARFQAGQPDTASYEAALHDIDGRARGDVLDAGRRDGGVVPPLGRIELAQVYEAIRHIVTTEGIW